MPKGAFPLGAVVATLVLLGACEMTAEPDQHCSVTSLQAIAGDPPSHAGKVLCGDVFALERRRGVRLLSSRDEAPSMDLAWLVTTATRHHLKGLTETPQRYYVEAVIDPMTQCFEPSGSGESCSPNSRPIFMHVRRARRR